MTGNETITFQNCNLYMRIITLHQPISDDELLVHLRQNLNPMFKQQRQEDIDFVVAKVNYAIEILQPQLYEGALFIIEVKGNQLHITRNEHYIDDVNLLTINSILNSLFEDLTDDIRGVDLVQEG
jgi:hypothetical protein